jgi:cell division protein FtsW (lipid II flippase)
MPVVGIPLPHSYGGTSLVSRSLPSACLNFKHAALPFLE